MGKITHFLVTTGPQGQHPGMIRVRIWSTLGWAGIMGGGPIDTATMLTFAGAGKIGDTACQSRSSPSKVRRPYGRDGGRVIVAISDVVVGVFSREQLSTGLVAVHRQGFGPQARVLDSARGRLDDQLRKAGVQISASFAADDVDSTLILVRAPGRAERAIEALTGAGALAVYVAARPGQVIDAGVGETLQPAPLVSDTHRPPAVESFER